MLPPPLPNRDREQLNLLAVFHFVLAGLDILLTGFFVLHYFMMKLVFSNPAMWEQGGNKPPFNPGDFFALFVWVYVFVGLWQAASATLNIVSGFHLRKQKHRIFSMVVAGLNCMFMPLGTILGVFTLVVLCRDSAIRLYAAKDSTAEASSSSS